MRDTRKDQLFAVQQRFERWRKEHGGRGIRIPDGLWAEAVAVARIEGVDETARALRIDVVRLEGRIGEVEVEELGLDGSGGNRDHPHGVGVDQPAFIELKGVASTPLSTARRTVVELIARSGDRMRIDMAGASSSDLVGLARAFWEREP